MIWNMFQSCCLAFTLLLMGVLIIAGCGPTPDYAFRSGPTPDYAFRSGPTPDDVFSIGETVKIDLNEIDLKKWEGSIDLSNLATNGGVIIIQRGAKINYTSGLGIKGSVVQGEDLNKYLEFDKWIELRNGTRYVCKDFGGCRIDFAKGSVVTKGTIEVYKNYKQ